MNLPKAIEILELNRKVGNKKMPPDVKDALELGIKALEEVIHYRNNPECYLLELLVGETK